MSREHHKKVKETLLSNKEHQKHHREATQTRIKVSEPPEKLPYLLNLLNLLPSHGEELTCVSLYLAERDGYSATRRVLNFPNSDAVEPFYEFIKTLPPNNENYLLIQQSFEKFFHFLSPEIREYLYPSRISPQDYDFIKPRYDELLDTFDTLHFALKAKTGNYESNPYKPKTAFFMLTSIALVTDLSGRITPMKSLVVEALEGADAERIRICSICGNIFWAKQLNIMACSKPCAHSRRVRKWREKYPDYELNRYKANLSKNKILKKLEQKTNKG